MSARRVIALLLSFYLVLQGFGQTNDLFSFLSLFPQSGGWPIPKATLLQYYPHVNESQRCEYEAGRILLKSQNFVMVQIFELDSEEKTHKGHIATFSHDAKFIDKISFDADEDRLIFHPDQLIEQHFILEEAAPGISFFKIQKNGSFHKLDPGQAYSQKKYPYTQFRPITFSDIQSLEKKELELMHNEILAGHGFIFQSGEWAEYFSQYQWYQPVSSNIESQLTFWEKENIHRIEFARNHPLSEVATYFSGRSDSVKEIVNQFRFQKSAVDDHLNLIQRPSWKTAYKKLEIRDIEWLTKEELSIMKYEILADYGCIFRKFEWNHFFEDVAWYIPRFHSVDEFLTPLEKENMRILSFAEKHSREELRSFMKSL